MAPLAQARAGRERVPANGWELNPPADLKAWSAPTAKGYTDFPFHPPG